jgi:hypothetical protein
VPPSIARDLFDRIVSAADPVAVMTGFVNSDSPTFTVKAIPFFD